jgi:serine phosphatase RsbU (regulator of sigma subunit)
MDMGICLIEPGSSSLIYAGAKAALYRVRRQECETIKGDRRSIGYRGSYSNEPFTNHRVTVEEDDTFYICSDGYPDQVGGTKRIPFGMRRLLKLFSETSCQPFAQQQEIFMQTMLAYQGNEKRRDDVTMLGFRCRISNG